MTEAGERTRLDHELFGDASTAISSQDGDGGNVPVWFFAIGQVIFPEYPQTSGNEKGGTMKQSGSHLRENVSNNAAFLVLRHIRERWPRCDVVKV